MKKRRDKHGILYGTALLAISRYSSNSLKTELLCDPAILATHLKELETGSQRDMYTCVMAAALLTIAKKEAIIHVSTDK